MAVDAALLDRAGELKRELVAFSRQPRYDRAFSELLARHDGGSEVLDEHRLMMLWDYFVLEHRLRNGRTIVERFVDAHPELSRQEREMLLGWRDVVQGPFEVRRRDGPALIVVNLVDDLTYRVRSNLHDDSVEPMVLRRLANRDPDKASMLFRRLLKRPRFDWSRDGEELLHTAKAAYFARVPRPRVSPLSERLAAYAGRR